MSNLILGFMGNSITKDEKPFHGRLISKIGGTPYWLNNKTLDIPECPRCKKPLVFICQLYTAYEPKIMRMIYVFGCLSSRSCLIDPSSWKVVRGCVVAQTIDKNVIRDHKEMYNQLNKIEFLANSSNINYPIIPETFDPILNNDFFIESLTPSKAPINQFFSSKPPQNQPTLDYPEDRIIPEASTWNTKCYLIPPTFIKEIEDDGEEEDFQDYLDLHAQSLLDEFRKREEDGILSIEEKPDQNGFSGSQNWDKEEYEPTSNKEFLRFQKALRRYPDQIIRYCYGGNPISPNPKFSENKVPNCKICNSKCVFEFQILPTIFYQLIKRFKKDLSLHFPQLSLESTFGSLIIYSCLDDCIPRNSYTFEHIFIDPEPI